MTLLLLLLFSETAKAYKVDLNEATPSWIAIKPYPHPLQFKPGTLVPHGGKLYAMTGHNCIGGEQIAFCGGSDCILPTTIVFRDFSLRVRPGQRRVGSKRSDQDGGNEFEVRLKILVQFQKEAQPRAFAFVSAA